MNNDRTVVLAVVIGLVLVALGVIVGSFYLAGNNQTIPGELIGIAGVAVGAIAGILAKTATEPGFPVVIPPPAPPLPPVVAPPAPVTVPVVAAEGS